MNRMLQGKLSALHCQAVPTHLSIPAPFHKGRLTRPSVRRRAAEPTPEQAAEMQKAMEAAMKDPQVAQKMSALQEAMKDPTVQQQMAEMQAAMQNKGLQERMAQLKDDPELAPMFEDIQKNGMQAMMKYWNDPKVLAKIGERMGDVSAAAPAGASAASPTMPSAPEIEIENLLDAAKYGDLEAVEDFIAIGRDVNEFDADQRTPLHYAVAYNHADIVAELVANGANLEAQDSKQNTVLHYACGYGRSELVRLLLEKGADSVTENGSGQTPLDLVTSEPKNPINKDAETLKLLEHAVTSALQS